MVGKALQPGRQLRIARRNLAALPAARTVRPDFRVGILAESRGKRLLISGLDGKAGQNRRSSLLQCAR